MKLYCSYNIRTTQKNGKVGSRLDPLANGSSLSAWSKGRRPSGAVLHSSRELAVWRPCSDLMDMLRRLINCHIIIIIYYYYVQCTLAL